MTVQVPVRTVTMYTDTGRKEDYPETTELFELKKKTGTGYETLSSQNSGNWVELTERTTPGTEDKSFTTYVYAYKIPLKKGETTEALFDAVRLKNVIEGYSEISHISTKDEYPVIVNGYAIQASDVYGEDGTDVTLGDVSEADLLRMYDVYINQNGTSTGSMNLFTDPSTKYQDGNMLVPEIQKKTGYKSDGYWYDDRGNKYAPGTAIPVTDEIRKNSFNIHVNWEPIKYTVHFDANGGSGTMQDMELSYDEAKNLTANGFTSTGGFAGWSLAKTGSVNFKDTALIKNLTGTDGDTITLFALWKKSRYTITFDAANKGNFDGRYENGDTLKTFRFVNGISDGFTGMESAGIPASQTKTFSGWYTAPVDGEIVSYHDHHFYYGNSADPAVITKDTTFYAQGKTASAKYAVMIYGIEEDTLEDGSIGGLTFGPATGADYTVSSNSHTVDSGTIVQSEAEPLDPANIHHNVITGADAGTDVDGNAYRCIHYDNWNTIIYWNTKDPHVYDKCLANDCTHSVILTPSEEAKAVTFPGTLTSYRGDGAGSFYDELVDNNSGNISGKTAADYKYRNFQWNQSGTTSGYGGSRIRALLNGYDGNTNLSVAGASATAYTDKTSFLSAFPENLRNAIGKKAVRYAKDYTKYNTTSSAQGRAVMGVVYDKLWLFSTDEIYGLLPDNYDANYGKYFNYYDTGNIGESGRMKGNGQYTRTRNMNLKPGTDRSMINQEKLTTYSLSDTHNYWLRSLYNRAKFTAYIYSGGYLDSFRCDSRYSIAPGFVLKR